MQPDFWIQQDNPTGSWVLSTLIASLPLVVLLGLLITGKANAWQAAWAGLITAFAVATTVFEMPLDLAARATAVGAVFSLFRIIWLITGAVFLYDIAVRTGQFEVMKASIAGLSGDRRIQAVLVAFAFGAFIEGAAGFGAPVAISAAFLVGLGFKPMQAAILCLVANTAPVAWGGLGTPIRTLGAVTSLDVEALSAVSGRILPPVSFIVPIWLVTMMCGFRNAMAIGPALVVIGGVFSVVQWFWSNHVGFELVDIVSSLSSLAAAVILLKFWKPEQEWHFPDEPPPTIVAEAIPLRSVARAWAPFGILTVLVMIWGIPDVKKALSEFGDFRQEMPGLHKAVAKSEALTGRAVPDPKKDLEDAFLDIVPASSTGTATMIAAVISGLFLGLSPVELVRMFFGTLDRLRPAMAAILGMLCLGYVTKYAGMDAVLGLAMTRTGANFYPVFAALLGWLGVALTGSDTASNVLFGNLQVITAEKLGLSPLLMASANTTGGVMGKMIDAQSIVVAAAATGEHGQEGAILRAVLGHSLALAMIVGAIVWLYAHVIPWAVQI
ncbi:L-lactate permease [bacterium]|nr:L-lactate permease [bacterium]